MDVVNIIYLELDFLEIHDLVKNHIIYLELDSLEFHDLLKN